MEAERRALRGLQEGYAELKNQLHNCPESLREHLQEQLKRVGVRQEATNPADLHLRLPRTHTHTHTHTHT